MPFSHSSFICLRTEIVSMLQREIWCGKKEEEEDEEELNGKKIITPHQLVWPCLNESLQRRKTFYETMQITLFSAYFSAFFAAFFLYEKKFHFFLFINSCVFLYCCCRFWTMCACLFYFSFFLSILFHSCEYNIIIPGFEYYFTKATSYILSLHKTAQAVMKILIETERKKAWKRNS